MAEEKIRLVLNVSGVQDVKGLKDEMQALADALGVVDTKFEQVEDSSAKARKKLDDAKESVGKKGGGTGAAAALLDLGYILDDVQYGFRGVVNNIPGFVQKMGLGAGVAGVAGIAAVAINQLIQSFPELTDWMSKARPKIEELVTAIGKQTAEVDRLKKEYEKLKDVDKDTFANRAKLITVTEDLKVAEEALRKEKEAMKAFEDAEKNVGEGETEKVKRQQQSFKELIVETGRLKALRDQMMADASRQEDPISDDEAALAGAKAGDSFQNVKGGYKPEDHNDLAASIYNRATDDKKQEMRQRGRAAIQQQREQEQKERVGGILDKMQNAKTEEELNEAFEEMAQISPAAANELRQYHLARLESEELDRQVEASIGGMQEARAAREKRLAENTKQINNMKRFFAATEQAGKKDDAKAKAAQQEKDKAEKAEEQRVKIRDQVMERNGMTPEGLAMQRQNAGVGATAAANRNRAGMANNQQQQMEAEFRRQGMTAEEAKKTTQEVMKAGDNIVRTMVQNGRLTLNRFKQIEMTQNELMRMMAEQGAGQVGMPGRQFNAGRR